MVRRKVIEKTKTPFIVAGCCSCDHLKRTCQFLSRLGVQRLQSYMLLQKSDATVLALPSTDGQ